MNCWRIWGPSVFHLIPLPDLASITNVRNSTFLLKARWQICYFLWAIWSLSHMLNSANKAQKQQSVHEWTWLCSKTFFVSTDTCILCDFHVSWNIVLLWFFSSLQKNKKEINPSLPAGFIKTIMWLNLSNGLQHVDFCQIA